MNAPMSLSFFLYNQFPLKFQPPPINEENGFTRASGGAGGK